MTTPYRAVSPLPSPIDLGFSSKFEEFRLPQIEAIDSTIGCSKRFIGIVAPCGFGKALYGMGATRLMPGAERAAYLTSTRGLQDQACLPPETRVLRGDLRYVPIGDLRPGDVLLAFDEERNGTRRRWQPSTVLRTIRIKRPCVRLSLDDGTEIVCTTDHAWLTERGGGGTARWMRTDQMRVGPKVGTHIVRLLDVWTEDTSREAGYLAGAYDGEGHLHQGDPARGNGADVNLGFAQTLNVMAEEVAGLLGIKGFSFATAFREAPSIPAHWKTAAVFMLSGRAEILRFLGQIRPLRLLAKLDLNRLGMIGPVRRPRVLRCEAVGVQEVVALETSTRTYVAEGLASHNCNDFKSLGLVDVRGQANYPCIALEPGSNLSRYRNRRRHFAGCDEGPCHVGVKCHHNFDPREPHIEPYCGYYKQVWKAQRAGLVNTNYAYWMTSASYGQGLGEFDLAVCDEAHNAIEELERFLVFEITTEDVGRLNAKLLDTLDPQVWGKWADTHYVRLMDRLTYLERTLPTTAEDATERRRLKNLHSKLERLADLQPDQWVIEREPWKVRFSPLDVAKYAEDFLFRKTPKVVLMSATLTPKTLDMLGIPESEREIFEFPSTFPVERRPVYAFDLSIEVRVRAWDKMSAQDHELWLDRIDRIIDPRVGLKGIIHCVSYARGKYLVEHSRHRELMIFHDNQTTQTAVDAFKLHEGGAILVSPSIMTGFDFPADECRYQIIGKVPIPDNRGPIMQARIAADPDYSWYIAMQKTEQAVGRGMRAEDDWCETFIVDDTFGAWFLKKARPFATKHFLESVQFVSYYPDAMIA